MRGSLRSCECEIVAEILNGRPIAEGSKIAFPQGLKPRFLVALNGPAEADSFQNERHAQIPTTD
jgi:hypothetical protein